MDTWINLFKVMSLLSDGSKTIGELSQLSSLSLKELKNLFKTIQKFQLQEYLNLQFYNGSEEIYFLENIDEETIKKIEVLAWWDLRDIDKINDFNEQQQWILYKIFKECSNNFIEDVANSFLETYDSDFQRNYNYIKNRIIIKQYMDIFNSHNNILIELYYAIVNKKCLNLKLRTNNVIYDISPIKIHFNDDLNSWYLQYGKKKQNRIIRLDKISSIEESNYIYKSVKSQKFNWGWSKNSQTVKVRIYNEKNAKEIALRFLARKDIVFVEKHESYIDYLINVSDINLFIRWARSMAPQLIILQPSYLRIRMEKEILEWESMYLK